MIALAERKTSMKKFTSAFIKCGLCLYGNYFEIEIKKTEDGKFFYMESCPRCHHFEDVKEVTKREASKYLILEDIA